MPETSEGPTAAFLVARLGGWQLWGEGWLGPGSILNLEPIGPAGQWGE